MQTNSKYSVSILGLILALIISCEPDKPKLPDNLLNGRTTAIFNPDKSYGTVTDIDGNVYKTIQIGNQTWMAENLRVTHYRNGDEIPNIKDTAEWAIQTQGAYCNYKNTEDMDTIATYGRLYNWYVTQDPRNIAPVGWRVPNYADWGTFIDYLGGGTIASKHLEEAEPYIGLVQIMPTIVAGLLHCLVVGDYVDIILFNLAFTAHFGHHHFILTYLPHFCF